MTAYNQPLAQQETAKLEAASKLYAQATNEKNLRKAEEIATQANGLVSNATSHAYYLSFRSAAQSR